MTATTSTATAISMSYTKKTPPLSEFPDDVTIQTASSSAASSLASSSSSSSSVIYSKSKYTPTQSAAAHAALQQLQVNLAEQCASSCSPGVTTTTTTTLHLDSMKENFDLDTLSRFYHELMIPNFPLEEERDDLEDWLLYLDPSSEEAMIDGGPSMDVLILRSSCSSNDGENNTTDTIIGGIAFEYYPQARTGLLSYMVVSTDFRRLGILATLHPVFCEALQGLHQVSSPRNSATKISAILAETNTTTAGDVPPHVARKRHEILFKLGYRLLEFPYVQPPLAPDVDSFDDIMLLVYVGTTLTNTDSDEEEKEGRTTSPTHVPTHVLHDYVLDFYHSVFGHNSLDFQDHWYYQLVTWYAKRHPTTNIRMDLPWEDVTPQMTQGMAMDDDSPHEAE